MAYIRALTASFISATNRLDAEARHKVLCDLQSQVVKMIDSSSPESFSEEGKVVLSVAREEAERVRAESAKRSIVVEPVPEKEEEDAEDARGAEERPAGTVILP
jgi:hypothetical protein